MDESAVKPWDELSRIQVLEAERFRIVKVDMVLPDGTIGRGWHLIDFKQQAVGVIPVRADGSILLIDHFRFTTRTRGWEIPAGGIEAGELPIQAAARELREETGHVARLLEPLGSYNPSNGSSNQVFNLLIARDVQPRGVIEDTNEVDGLDWFTPAEVRRMLARNEIKDGMSITGLLWYFFETENQK